MGDSRSHFGARGAGRDRRWFTITIVLIINPPLVTGAVSAGGLGDLAMRYGYQRFNTTVMVVVIAILIVIVTPVQWVGDALVRRLDHK